MSKSKVLPGYYERYLKLKSRIRRINNRKKANNWRNKKV